jgi:hypothetical protein
MAKLLCLHYWLSYTFYSKMLILRLKYYTHEFPVLTGIMHPFVYFSITTDLGNLARFLVQTPAMMKY